MLSLSACTKPLNQIISASESVISTKSIKKDPNNILDVHSSLSYNIISREGDLMSDGYSVPGYPDGMGAFSIDKGRIVLVRNHELGRTSGILKGPFKNPTMESVKLGIKQYDSDSFGGTTNIVIDQSTNQVVKEYLSLIGTMTNCAGGITPWNTWLTCEENIYSKQDNLVSHGYVFEVDPKKHELQDPIPLTQMGRFQHEAVAFDRYGIAYLTEDRNDGLIYKYIPKTKDSLAKGSLYALKIKIKDSRNWKKRDIAKNKKYEVEWIKMEDVDPDSDTLREEGRQKGATVFARGEGITYDGDSIYICCTSGGKYKKGQIWKLTPSSNQNSALELWYEVDHEDGLNMPDNLTIAPWGDLIVCEDNPVLDRLWGITQSGRPYLIAENNYTSAELAGACFSPGGNTLYINIQQNGLTISIDGDWNSVRTS